MAPRGDIMLTTTFDAAQYTATSRVQWQAAARAPNEQRIEPTGRVLATDVSPNVVAIAAQNAARRRSARPIQ
jgi:hypothetical protein